MKDTLVYISIILGGIVYCFTSIYRCDTEHGLASTTPVPIWKYFLDVITLKYFRNK